MSIRTPDETAVERNLEFCDLRARIAVFDCDLCPPEFFDQRLERSAARRIDFRLPGAHVQADESNAVHGQRAVRAASCGLQVTLVTPQANAVVTVLPTIIAPPARNACTYAAS